MRSLNVFAVIGLSGLAMLFNAQDAAAGVKWSEGHWRLELAGYGGLDTSHNKRSDDLGVVGTIEYEAPVFRRVTLSLRMQPLFFYGQEQDDIRLFRRFRDLDNFNPDYDDDDVWGLGFGPALRIYQRAEERTGVFGEIAFTALVHSNQFIDNDSNVNFSSEFGVGYRFRGGWHVVGRWRHISNAGLGEDNSATNGWGLGFGYSF